MSRDGSGKPPGPVVAEQADRKPAPRKAKKAAEAPLGWFERLKRKRLRFVRKGLDIQVLFEDPAERRADAAPTPASADTSEAATISKALKEVLDRHPSSRSVLVHLGVLEKALKQHGLKALDQLPAEVLNRAMSQLETLVSDGSQGSLAALRSRMTTILIEHGRALSRQGASDRLSDFQDSKRLEVDEASVSTFMEAQARWQRSMTGGR